MLFVIIIGFMLISMLVGFALKNRFAAYSKIPLRSGLSGKEVAERMLRENGLHDVQVTCVPGHLSDHYNPADRTINLSPDVYNGRHVAAAAVAAHECGHAVQHATSYPFLQFRSAMVPVVNFSSRIINFIFIASLMGAFAFHWFSFDWALLIIIACQGAITLFSLVTLPVEFDATGRGLAWLNQTGLTHGEEHTKASKALSLAATTYVVAALSSLTVLLYYILQYLGSRD
ncbi:MAG: zinc metallopeptidase [Candidatus Competibacteraceae bacterium]|nr:zinc metallopeptidase [Candidatus Competibacteraceae bacterium]